MLLIFRDRVKSFEMSKQSLILHLCGRREKKKISIDLVTWACRKIRDCCDSKCCRKQSEKVKDCDLCGDKNCDVSKNCPRCNFCLCHVCLRFAKGSCVRCKVQLSLEKFGQGKCAMCQKVFLTSESRFECEQKNFDIKNRLSSRNEVTLCEDCFDGK